MVLFKHIIETTQEKMTNFGKKKDIIYFSTKAKEVFDVSGAGDTVVAAITMSLIHNYSLEDAVRIANIAAGIKVGKHGTAPVSLQELCDYYYVNWE
jgi:bifunctional ADP-heptose synthase (sugar kinase/adenylyltransferase)